MTQSKRYGITPKRLTFVQQHYTIMDGKDDISNVIREKKAARVTWVGFFYQSHLVCRKNHSRHMGAK